MSLLLLMLPGETYCLGLKNKQVFPQNLLGSNSLMWPLKSCAWKICFVMGLLLDSQEQIFTQFHYLHTLYIMYSSYGYRKVGSPHIMLSSNTMVTFTHAIQEWNTR